MLSSPSTTIVVEEEDDPSPGFPGGVPPPKPSGGFPSGFSGGVPLPDAFDLLLAHTTVLPNIAMIKITNPIFVSFFIKTS